MIFRNCTNLFLLDHLIRTSKIYLYKKKWNDNILLSKNFRADVDIEAVFLHPDEPELEFEGFLKKRYPRYVIFIQISFSLDL